MIAIQKKTIQLVTTSFCLFMFGFAIEGLAVEKIEVANQYEYSPWSELGVPDSGLTRILVSKLNLMAQGKYEFEAKLYPRKRLEQHLKTRTTIVVPWVNPQFFNDTNKEKFLWSQDIVEDESLFISHENRKFEFIDSESFNGKRFSGTLGHNYPDLQTKITSGDLVREDAVALTQSISKLLSGKRNLDFAVIDRSTLAAEDIRGSLRGFYISKKPRTPRFARNILIPKQREDLLVFINQAIVRLSSDLEWQSELKKYSLQLK